MTLQETVFSGQMLAAVPIAMLAGLISFASPCVLPLVPGYLGFVSSSAFTVTTRRTLGGAALFVVGFGLVFVVYGAAFGTAGAWLFRWQDVIIRLLGLVVIIMGAAFIGLFRPLQRTVRTSWRPRSRPSPLSASTPVQDSAAQPSAWPTASASAFPSSSSLPASDGPAEQ